MHVWRRAARISIDSKGPARRSSRGPEGLRRGDSPGGAFERSSGQSESKSDLRHQSSRLGSAGAARKRSWCQALLVLLLVQHLWSSWRQDSGRDGGVQSSNSLWALESSCGTRSVTTGERGIQPGVSEERDGVWSFTAAAI